MKAVKMTIQNVSELLFKEKERLPHFSYYLSKAGEDEYEWAFEIGVLKFADSYLVIGNYYGGGSPFCCDITDDSDESALFELFDSYLKNIGCEMNDGERIVYVDAAGSGGVLFPEITIVLEDGFLSGVYSNIERLGVELIDLDVTEEEAVKDNDKAMEEIRKDYNEGRLFSHW